MSPVLLAQCRRTSQSSVCSTVRRICLALLSILLSNYLSSLPVVLLLSCANFEAFSTLVLQRSYYACVFKVSHVLFSRRFYSPNITCGLCTVYMERRAGDVWQIYINGKISIDNTSVGLAPARPNYMQAQHCNSSVHLYVH